MRLDSLPHVTSLRHRVILPTNSRHIRCLCLRGLPKAGVHIIKKHASQEATREPFLLATFSQKPRETLEMFTFPTRFYEYEYQQQPEENGARSLQHHLIWQRVLLASFMKIQTHNFIVDDWLVLCQARLSAELASVLQCLAIPQSRTAISILTMNKHRNISFLTQIPIQIIKETGGA